MADARTLEPSEKRLRDARRRGSVPRSPAFVAAGTLLLGGLALGAVTEPLLDALEGTFVRLLALPEGSAERLLGEALAPIGAILLPPLLVLSVAPILLSVAHLGPIWAPLRPAPREPLFSWDRLTDPLRGLLAIAVALGALALALRALLPGLLGGITAGPAQLRAGAETLGQGAIGALGAALLGLGGLDLIYRRWAHRRALRMSWRDKEREQRESEGDPRSRRSIRRRAKEAGRIAEEAALGSAKILLTAPGRAAVALGREEGAPPRVLASARGAFAGPFERKAREQKVPRRARPALAEALAALPLGAPVPEALYPAIARALRDVRRRGAHGVPR